MTNAITSEQLVKREVHACVSALISTLANAAHGLSDDHTGLSAASVGGVMTQSCKTCRWFDPSFAPDEDEHEALGLCEWPADRLPYSLRWGNRERVAVCPLDGSDCPCYEPAP